MASFRSVLSWCVVSLAFGVQLGACAPADDARKPDVVERTEAQARCDALMRAWCAGALACVEAGLDADAALSDGERNAVLGQCLDGAKLTCDATSSVAAERYDACVASVETLSAADCAAVTQAVDATEPPPLPASCDELFVTE